MTTQKPPNTSESGYECIHCASPVDSLYTSYFQQSNTSLLECPRCGQLGDDFLSFPFSISLLNLLLLKPTVYRHLLRNRGGETPKERRKHQAIETVKLAAISIFVDTLVRSIPHTTSNDLETVELFVKTFGYCTLETLSLLTATIIAAVLLGPRRTKLNDLALLPLALLYSSLPTTFFLVVSSIVWRQEYLPSPSLSSTPAALLDLSPYLDKFNPSTDNKADSFDSTWAKYVVSYSRSNLRSGLAQVGSARGWASEAVLRKGVGGTSAIVAVSVVLRISKVKAIMVMGLAWIVHLVLLHALDQLIA